MTWSCIDCNRIYEDSVMACSCGISTVRDPILVEREKTHGSFEHTARLAQGLKEEIRDEPGFEKLNDRHKEVIDMIFTKIARIVSGNSNEKDHFADIAGYAKLGAEACE